MKKVKILKNVIAHGEHYKKDQVVEVTDAIAAALIKGGYAEEAKADAKPGEEDTKGKTKKNGGAAALIILAFLLSFFCSAPKAVALDGLTALVTTNAIALPTKVTGGAVSNLTTSTAFTVPRGKGFSAFVTFAGTNAATTDAISIDFAPTYDGTTYATTNYITLTASANKTAGVTGFTNFPATLTDNCVKWKAVRVRSAADPTNNIFFTNAVAVISN